MPKDDLSAGSLSFRPGRRTPRTVLRISRMVCSNPVGQRKEGEGVQSEGEMAEQGKAEPDKNTSRGTGRKWVSG